MSCMRFGGGGRDEAPMAMTPTLRTDLDHEYHQDDDRKRSVLAKVKEKTRKWRHTLAKKQHGHGESNPTPAWGVTLDDDDDDEEEEWDDQYPQYHRSAGPTAAYNYESKMASNAYSYRKEARQYQLWTTDILPNPQKESAVLLLHPSHSGDAQKEMEPNHHLSSSKEKEISMATIERSGSFRRLAGAMSGMLAPAYNIVSGATQMIVSKIQGPGAGAGAGMGEKLISDKGVSVKEYLMHKLEPGDGERALSEVITEALSPRKAAQRQSEGVAEELKGR